MSLFESLLEIKTGKKSHLLKAAYINNSTSNKSWSYFIYYYDLVNHTFYIDDLPQLGSKNRTSAINIIEHIATKIYYQELNSLGHVIKQIQRKKKPIFYYFYKQKSTGLFIIDTVDLKMAKDKKWNIVRFFNPAWDKTPLQRIMSTI